MSDATDRYLALAKRAREHADNWELDANGCRNDLEALADAVEELVKAGRDITEMLVEKDKECEAALERVKALEQELEEARKGQLYIHDAEIDPEADALADRLLSKARKVKP